MFTSQMILRGKHCRRPIAVMRVVDMYVGGIISHQGWAIKVRDQAKKLWILTSDLDGESDGSEGDFMSEAKDWAGELISGQTGAGKMLVSQVQPNVIFVCCFICKKLYC